MAAIVTHAPIADNRRLMPYIYAIGPLVALIGIGAVFFVLRRKSVDKRSMYSARRSQIEHKVRAARQRTLAPHGRTEKAEEAPGAGGPASPFATAAPQVTYEPSAYEPPPAIGVPEAPSPSPWDVGPAMPPATQYAPTTPPPAYEPTPPAYEPAPPAYEPAPAETAWNPAPAPTEPPAPVEPARPAAPTSAPAAWSVVTEAKATADVPQETRGKKKGKQDATAGAWQLASGDAPGTESEGEAIKAPGQAVAIAQYAILVVGLVAVLIGVLIMVASSPVR
jgi:hypothetical protein